MTDRRLVFLLAAALAGAPTVRGAIFGVVRGIVHDPDHRPIPGAVIKIRSDTIDWSRTAQTTAAGEFEFAAVPVGAYRVTVTHEGFSPAEQHIAVASGSAPVLHFQLNLAALAQSVEASETADQVRTEPASTTTLVSRSQIERTPGADRTNSLAAITDNIPGAYITHDQLHIRGGHQVSWLVDGVPVPNTNIASNVGPQFDPKDADYIEVERGNYSAEYGDRTYGIFNVVPRTGFERDRGAELIASYGTFHQTNDQLNFGSHSERFAWYASVNGNRTDLGLETPVPELLHDTARGLGGFGTLIWNADPANQFRLVSSLRRDTYQIPNTPDQQAGGIRDNERESDAFINLSWVHTAGQGVLLTVSPFYHFNRSNYVGGPNDSPLSPQDDRASHYAGAQAALSAVTRRHNARVGLYGFGQQDANAFGLTGAGPDAVSLRQTQTLAGHLEALFLEDQYKPASWLTVTGGVRLTHFSGALSENAADPRAGVALRLPRWNWVFRGYYGRFYQAPPLSTVAGPLLAFAGEQGFGFLPLHGERDSEYQFGATVPLHGWAVDVDRFRSRATNYFDHNVLGNSNIFFPVSIGAARIRGWEVALRSPRLLRRGHIHLAYSRQVAEGEGAVTGGLTDFSLPEGVFLLDHDQRHTLNTGFDASLPFRAWLSGNAYYGSGFADDGGPSHLPGHTTLDLTCGKDIGEAWSISVTALNVANRHYLLDNSLTFGGTHFAYPRQVYAQFRYRFRY